MKWQPMKYAPQDGTYIAVWCIETGRAGPDIAWWENGRWRIKYGWLPIGWAPMPQPPDADERAKLMSELG